MCFRFGAGFRQNFAGFGPVFDRVGLVSVAFDRFWNGFRPAYSEILVFGQLLDGFGRLLVVFGTVLAVLLADLLLVFGGLWPGVEEIRPEGRIYGRATTTTDTHNAGAN